MFVKTCFFNMFFNGAVGAVVGCTALLHPFPAHKHAGGQMSYVCPPAFKMLGYDYFTVCMRNSLTFEAITLLPLTAYTWKATLPFLSRLSAFTIAV